MNITKSNSNRKGIILAGGSGTRLYPATQAISKQLLPVYDKPLIFYPISTLMLAGIRQILIIVAPTQLSLFQTALGNGSAWGIEIEYIVQDEPRGIAHGLILADEFVGKDSFALILGDNVFYGSGLGRTLSKFSNVAGAHIFVQNVNNPERFGVLEVSGTAEIISLEEKPIKPKSSLAITGLYFFDFRAIEIAKTLKPGRRGELEILDVLNHFFRIGQLSYTKMDLGTAWLDTGTFQSLHDAGTFVRLIEERQGLSFGNPLEISRNFGWVQ